MKDIQEKEEEDAPAAPAPAGGGPPALPRPVGQGDAAGGGCAQCQEEGSNAQCSPQHLCRSAEGGAVPAGILMLKALAIQGSFRVANACCAGAIEFNACRATFQVKYGLLLVVSPEKQPKPTNPQLTVSMACLSPFWLHACPKLPTPRPGPRPILVHGGSCHRDLHRHQ